MKRILLSGVGLLAVMAIAAPALADEEPPPPQQVKRVKPARVTRPAPAPRAAEPARVRRAPVRRAEPVRQEPTRQASNGKSWSGSQLGSSNGGSFANNNFVEPGSYICPPGTELGYYCSETPFSFKPNQPSYTFGGYYGYNIQLGNFVIGVEGDASYKKSETSVQQITDTSYYSSSFTDYYYRNDNFTGKMTQGWDGSVRGRVGMLISPTLLIYGTGGVAFGKVSGSLSYVGTVTSPDIYAYPSCTDSYPCIATSHVSFSETRVGATGGFGVEMQLDDMWTARLEYRYTDLGKFTKNFPVYNTGCTTDNCGLSQNASIDLHPTSQTVQFGLSANPSALLSRLLSVAN